MFYFAGSDAKLRFSIMPVPGHESFEQWRAAIAALVRKPIGFPGYLRQRVGDIHSIKTSGLEKQIISA